MDISEGDISRYDISKNDKCKKSPIPPETMQKRFFFDKIQSQKTLEKQWFCGE